jgi:hypothetical protein
MKISGRRDGKRHDNSQFYGWSVQENPPLFGKIPEFRKVEEREKSKGKGVGKEQAERIIYWACIAAWLIPIVIAVMRWKVSPSI